MNGLYFYKLVSSFPEDVTKDCKLTVNEIDHNFMTLKKSDISNFYLDNDKGFLVLETKGGETYKADVSHFAKDVSVKYDKETGTIEINHDGVVDVIDDIVTKGNLSTEIVANIITDDTLVGNGSDINPMGLSNVEKTSAYKAVIKVIDKTKGCCLPYFEKNALGDRYLTYEEYNEYGYLYNYPSALRFVQDIESDWRIPTKADWDNMLNAIELCDEDRNHDATSCNNIFGKFAGKFLKSRDKWLNSECCDDDCHHHDCCDHDDDCNCSNDCDYDYLETSSVDDCSCNHHHHHHDCCDHHHHDCCHPQHKCVKPNGVDSYGMRILPSGYGDGGMMMDYFGRRAKFWTSTEIQVTNMYVKRFDYDKGGVVQVADNPRALASVRLVKDYDGSNFRAVETIGGVNYKCILMPAKNTTHGYLIWMASNLNASQKKYCPVLPNNGDISSNKKVYYINEWNGFDWVKKELMEGDSLVIKFGPDNERNAEYRLINGQLINIKKDIISNVENKYDAAIDEINGRLDVLEGEVSDIKDSIADINDKLVENDKFHQYLDERIDAEIKAREEVDTQMWEAINNEVSARTDVDNQLWDAINGEIVQREDVDDQLWRAVNGEISARTDVDAQMWEAINNEVSARTDVDNQLWDAVNGIISSDEDVHKQLWDAVNGEISARTDVDAQMWEAINNEASARTDSDKQLWDAVNGEISARTDVDAQMWEAINNEVSARTDVDNQLWDAVNGIISSSDGVHKELWDAINNEIERSVEQDKRLLAKEGSTFVCAEGILTLKADDPKNDIIIEWDGNYGTF